MEESGGDDRVGGDEISLLAKELIRLSIKCSIVVPNVKPTQLCTIWIEKSYNPDKDLETVMEGRPWLFQKNLVLFDRLVKLMERSQIRLNSFPFWIKIEPSLPEFDKKDLLYAIGVTFGGVIRSEINRDLCRLRIKLDVLKPLRRGVTKMLPEFIKQPEDENTMVWSLQDKLQSTGLEEMEKKQEEGSAMKKNERVIERNSMLEDKSNPVKKTSLKRIGPVVLMSQSNEDSIMWKRKST
ncbi:hypothetical protein Godav_020715 [Gossypium davidsonii]|uniref:DUF4283 domain-containing protein n=1 Tax=Gossypium davidsonii TaxID=34287 RepID=A0A7J8R406_GOSDV|nr:hypothetical protein [Gossypium davidsonii]